MWGSTYPYNPYPFPWVNHLFQDSPSIAIGLFEAHMRKMADNFSAIRRAELLRDGSYDAAAHEPALSSLTWAEFTDEEFALCPPILAMGGDGAMLDIGFQNLSRLLASGKPIRVIVLDTQVYSNTGGQACTSGFTGQVADMSGFGKAQHGKTEVRKELALLAIAHRGVYVHQTSQAAASHLIGGVLRGLHKRRPVLINVYTPCPVEHGLADDWSQHAARLALESRAFPFLTFDPDAGPTYADQLSLDGNPSVEDPWPTYTLHYLDAAGAEQALELPVTIADWAATEARFKQHFTEVPPATWDDAMMPFHEFLRLRPGRTGGPHAVHPGARQGPHAAPPPGVARNRAARRGAPAVLVAAPAAGRARDRPGRPRPGGRVARVGVRGAEHRAPGGVRGQDRRPPGELSRANGAAPRLGAARQGRRFGRGGGVPGRAAGGGRPRRQREAGRDGGSGRRAAPRGPGASGGRACCAGAPAVSAPATVATADDEAMVLEAWIDSDRCTTCNECTNISKKIFAYNPDKQAYIKDAGAGTFQQLVTAAERCPVSIIHPGTPLNPKEKDLEKWITRAKKFN